MPLVNELIEQVKKGERVCQYPGCGCKEADTKQIRHWGGLVLCNKHGLQCKRDYKR